MNNLDTFMRKINVSPSGCWEWTGIRNREGYGIYNMSNLTRSRLAHRISFALHIGPPLKDSKVCHHCDNPPCVNPSHLFIGRDEDNVRDMWEKKRSFTPFKTSPMCKRGHLFTEVSTYWKPNGRRTCRICSNIQKRNYNKTKREN